MNDDNWVTKLIGLYEEGRSDPEVRKALGITKRQWESYLSRSQEFRELVEWGRELAEAWHYEKSRDFITNADTTNVNLNALSKRMENMYGWSTKVDSRSQNAVLTVDAKQELLERLPDLLNQLGHEQAAQLVLEHKTKEESE